MLEQLQGLYQCNSMSVSPYWDCHNMLFIVKGKTLFKKLKDWHKASDICRGPGQFNLSIYS